MSHINNNFIYKLQKNILIKLPYRDFNSETSKDFRKFIPSIILQQSQSALILDFCNINFVDTEGLGTLLYLWRLSSERNNLLILCNVSPLIQNLLNQKAIPTFLEIVPTVKEATKKAEEYTAHMQSLVVASSRLNTIFGSYEPPSSDDITAHNIVTITTKNNLKIG